MAAPAAATAAAAAPANKETAWGDLRAAEAVAAAAAAAAVGLCELLGRVGGWSHIFETVCSLV